MDELDARAIERLEAVAGTERDPDRRAFAPIAELLRMAGRLSEARERAEAGTRSDPDFASGHMVAARIYADLGLSNEARSALAHVLRLDRGNAEAEALRAALEDADRESALDWARAQGARPAVDVGEGEVLTVTMGELYLSQGAAERAVGVFDALLSRDPGNEALRGKLEQARLALAQSDPGADSGADSGADPDRDTAVGSDADVESDVGTATHVEEPEPVAVSDLAPKVVPIESLAPQIVDVRTLAPDAPSEASGDSDDPDVDSFMAWLDDQ